MSSKIGLSGIQLLGHFGEKIGAVRLDAILFINHYLVRQIECLRLNLIFPSPSSDCCPEAV